MTSYPATRTAMADLAADLILYNGRIVTVDERLLDCRRRRHQEWPHRGHWAGRGARALGGPRTETVDLRGPDGDAGAEQLPRPPVPVRPARATA